MRVFEKEALYTKEAENNIQTQGFSTGLPLDTVLSLGFRQKFFCFVLTDLSRKLRLKQRQLIPT